MRKDIKKMDTISSEIKFLCRNEIKTTEELFLYKKETMDNLSKKMHARTILRRKRQKETNTEERQKLCKDILALSNSIFELKKEVGYCEAIEEHTRRIKRNIKDMKENEKLVGKETIKDELIRFS